jgi:NTP pyrophosphatase (non-canonical NTP hydrolase)
VTPAVNALQERLWTIHVAGSPHTADPARDLEWTALALCGEAGELANEIKKVARDDDGELTEDRVDRAMSELADVMVYAQHVARLLGFTTSELLARAELNALAFARRKGLTS